MEPHEYYEAPAVVELDTADEATLGRYAEDSMDQERYFE
ncbi:putative RiPP precursor [Haloactinospora alba]|nr:putative RiPP precursor [Haloactinospora alba]